MNKSKRRLTMRHKDSLAGYLFILPFIIGFIAFFLIPAVESIRYSLSEMTLEADRYQLTFVGLANYKQALLINKDFNPMLLNSIKQMLITVPLVLVFSFFTANILNQKFHGRALARAIFFLPVIVTAGVILGLESNDLLVSGSYETIAGTGGSEMSEFQRLFDLSRFLSRYTNINGPIVDYLTAAVDGIYDIVIASGVQILIFLAGLQSISPSLYEASDIEGATGWENFWKITFPMISPLIVVNLIYTVVDSFTNTTNEMMAMIDDVIFSQVKYGFGSAMSWIYFSVIAVLLALVGWLVSRKVYYET